MLKQRFLFQNSLFLCWQRRPSSDWFRAVDWLHFITCPLSLALKSCRHGLGLYYARQGAKPHQSSSPALWTFFLILQSVGLSVPNSLPKWQMVARWGKTHVFWEGHEAEGKQALSQKGKQAGEYAGGAWADPSYSLPQPGGSLFPWVLSCQCAAREKRGEGLREFQTCLTSFWEDGCTLCQARGCGSSASSKQMHLRLLSRECKR